MKTKQTNAIPDKSFKEKLASWLVKSTMKGKLMMGAGNYQHGI